MEQTELLRKQPNVTRHGGQSSTVQGRPHTVHECTTTSSTNNNKTRVSVNEPELQQETFLQRQRGHAPKRRRSSTTVAAEEKKKTYGCCWHLFYKKIAQVEKEEEMLPEESQEDRRLLREQYFCPAVLCGIVFPPLGIPALVLAILAHRIRKTDDQLAIARANKFAAMSWRLMKICLFIFAFGYVFGMFIFFAISKPSSSSSNTTEPWHQNDRSNLHH